PHAGELARAIMGRRTHPESGYRSCLGIIRQADRYGRDRVDAACARALRIGSASAKSVTAILKNGLDRAPPAATLARAAIEHDNIRGASYFDKEGDDDLRRDNSEVDRHEAALDGGDAPRDIDGAADGSTLH